MTDEVGFDHPPDHPDPDQTEQRLGNCAKKKWINFEKMWPVIGAIDTFFFIGTAEQRRHAAMAFVGQPSGLLEFPHAGIDVRNSCEARLACGTREPLGFLGLSTLEHASIYLNQTWSL